MAASPSGPRARGPRLRKNIASLALSLFFLSVPARCIRRAYGLRQKSNCPIFGLPFWDVPVSQCCICQIATFAEIFAAAENICAGTLLPLASTAADGGYCRRAA